MFHLFKHLQMAITKLLNFLQKKVVMWLITSSIVCSFLHCITIYAPKYLNLGTTYDSKKTIDFLNTDREVLHLLNNTNSTKNFINLLPLDLNRNLYTGINTHFPSYDSHIISTLVVWQYWWWMSFFFVITFFNFILLKITINDNISVNPQPYTSLKSNGRWGDLMASIFPVFWCTNILINSNYILKIIENHTESGWFTLRVRGKQWYWVYKTSINFNENANTNKIITGRGNVITKSNIQSTQDNLYFLKNKNKFIQKLKKTNKNLQQKNINNYSLYTTQFISFTAKKIIGDSILLYNIKTLPLLYKTLKPFQPINLKNLIFFFKKTLILNRNSGFYIHKQINPIFNFIKSYIQKNSIYKLPINNIKTVLIKPSTIKLYTGINSGVKTTIIIKKQCNYTCILPKKNKFVFLNKKLQSYNLNNIINTQTLLKDTNSLFFIRKQIDTNLLKYKNNILMFTKKVTLLNRCELFFFKIKKKLFNLSNGVTLNTNIINKKVVFILRKPSLFNVIINSNKYNIFTDNMIRLNFNVFIKFKNKPNLYFKTPQHMNNSISHLRKYIADSFDGVNIRSNSTKSVERLQYNKYVYSANNSLLLCKTIKKYNNIFIIKKINTTWFRQYNRTFNTVQQQPKSSWMLNKRYLYKVNSPVLINKKTTNLINIKTCVNSHLKKNYCVVKNSLLFFFTKKKINLYLKINPTQTISLFGNTFLYRFDYLQAHQFDFLLNNSIFKSMHGIKNRTPTTEFNNLVVAEQNTHVMHTKYNHLVGGRIIKLSDKAKNHFLKKTRLLSTYNTLLLPIDTNITIITNSFDVVHSWFIPGLGIKFDCVPGRSTHYTLKINKAGIYYGHCAEICGRFHHHMPIKIIAVPFNNFVYFNNLYYQNHIKNN